MKPCSPAPSYADAVEEIRQERLAEGPLDTRNADLAAARVEWLDASLRKIREDQRKRPLWKRLVDAWRNES